MGALALANGLLAQWFPVGGSIYELDPVLLHKTVPGTRRIQLMPERAGGGRNLIAINSKGYRGPELNRRGRLRVAVYGDSLVMAENVSYEESFPAQLSELWGGRVEVVSAGASGYGPDQVCLRLESELASLDPDLVVLVLCATNDFGDLLRNKLFRLQGGHLLQGQPELHEAAKQPFEEAQTRSSSPAIVRAFLHFKAQRARREQAAIEQASPPPALIGEYLEQADWEYRKSVLEGSEQVYSLLADVYDADVAIQPMGRSAQYKQDLLAAVLRRIQEACRRHDTRLACVVVPSAVDLDPAFRIQVDRQRYPGYSPSRLSRLCAQAAESVGISTLDLFDSFAQSDPASLFVGWDDIHWNERGIELGAKTFGHWLAAEYPGLLPNP